MVWVTDVALDVYGITWFPKEHCHWMMTSTKFGRENLWGIHGYLGCYVGFHLYLLKKMLGGGFKHIFCFHPWRNDPIRQAYFLDGWFNHQLGWLAANSPNIQRMPGASLAKEASWPSATATWHHDQHKVLKLNRAVRSLVFPLVSWVQQLQRVIVTPVGSREYEIEIAEMKCESCYPGLHGMGFSLFEMAPCFFLESL